MKVASSPAAAVRKQADISWQGDSLEVLQRWPSDIRQDFGHALRQMQDGYSATLNVRPMPSIGAGVFELKTEDEKTWYRLMYLARIEDVIYVLDCFQKDGRKTEKKDLETAGARLAQVKLKITEGRKNEKRNGK